MTRLAAPIIALALLLTGAVAAPAQPLGSIAAVVNDDVITQTDLDSRLRLAMVGSGVAATPENMRQLAPQMLRTLIDEALQRQEAARYGIAPTDEQVETAIAGLAEQNDTSVAELEGILRQAGVPRSALETQIRTQLAWAQLITQRMRPQVQISDADVDDTLAQIEANRGQPEYQLADLFLSVDSPAQEAEVRAFAEDLVAQIRRGARFSVLARQFSQSAGASTGGDIGWVMESQLDPALARTITAMSFGEVSDPIRTLDGYHIVLLRDTRRVAEADPGDTVLRLVQFGLGFPPAMPAAQREQGMQLARNVAAVRGCDAMQAKARELGIGEAASVGQLRVKELSSQFRQAIEGLPIGQATAPIRMDGGVVVLMVCDRQEPQSGPPTREQIQQQIGQERLDVLSRRYLRDLRSAAFTDIRAPELAGP